MNRGNISPHGRTATRNPESASGFSFVELMVAMTIFAFVMIGAANVLTVANFNQKKNMQLRQAESVALGIVENFSAGNPSKFTADGTGKAVGGYRSDPYDTANEHIYYKWTSTDAWNMKRLDLVVGYGSNAACTQAEPEKCTKTMHVSTHYEP